MWDFRLPRVQSINTSGHKFGLVYPRRRLGDLARRRRPAPQAGWSQKEESSIREPRSSPVLHVPAARLRRSADARASRDVATALATKIGEMAEYRLISRGDELPVFAFTTADDVSGLDVFAVSRGLRELGWQVPAYTFPDDRTDLAVLRVVCRNGFSHDLARSSSSTTSAPSPRGW